MSDTTTSGENGSDYGVIAPEAMSAITQMRARANLLLRELGKLELQKLSVADELKALEAQTNGLLKIESEKLGIPDGASWTLTPEGKALAINTGTPEG